MPKYRYNAVDASGKWVTGEIQGSDYADAEAELKGRGLKVEALDESEPMAEVRKAGLTKTEVVKMVEQLAALTRSGLPLPSGLRAAGVEMISPSLRASFFDMANRLESGANLDEVIASGGAFPAKLRGLILAGTRTGRLADVLGEYVRSANLGAELRRVFWRTLAYPLFALAIVLGLVGFVCSLSVKAIESMTGVFGDFGDRQTMGTAALISMARFITSHGLEILIGAIVIAALTWLMIRVFLTPASRRRIYCSIPVIGPILKFTSLTEFCHLLGMFVEAGLPLPLAFELAGASVNDPDVAEACGRMGRAVASGEPLSSAVLYWDSIPAGLGQLFRWSEDQRSLPEALHLAGDMFESRARSQSSFACGVLSAFMLLLIIWWIGFALASFYLPMISLISRLSG